MKHLSRKILEQMLAHSSEGIIVAAANNPDFPVVYANPAYERLTGASADELRGQCLPLLNGSNPGRDPDGAAEGRSDSR